ncbi:MAG: condensation domain-containing protein, partial [Acidobacteriota bacterium]
MTAEPTGAPWSEQGLRRHLISINCVVVMGKLNAKFVYSENIHKQESIEKLANGFIEALVGIITHCCSVDAGGYTPSDFPISGLDQEKLDQLVGKDRNIEDIYPLSPMQQGLFFHSLYSPGTGIYFEQFNCRLAGRFNIDAFKRAWQEIVNRHTVFRTSIAWQGLDEPLQIVYKRIALQWQEEDWRALTTNAQQQALAIFLNVEQQCGFDLSKAPLMRFSLLRVGDDSYKFVWSHHHLLMDGWCTSLLLKEVFAFYNAYSCGEQLQLEQSLPYRDYIVWLKTQDLSKAEQYWRATLDGFTTPTPLLVETLVQSSNTEGEDDKVEELYLSVELTEELQTLTRKCQLTLNTLVQGVWALILSRYSGQTDILFGVTVSGRPAELPGVETRVGLFINTLPLRIQVSETEQVVSWLKQLQEQQVEMRQYEYTPLIQIQNWSQLPKGQSLFESIFIFENYPIDNSLSPADADLQISDLNMSQKTNYPITIGVMPGSQLLLKTSYNGRRFETAMISRMLNHIHILLKGIVANPQQCISQLPLLSEQEEEQLLVYWNHTSANYCIDSCVHKLFEQRAERSGQSVALVFAGTDKENVITYQELNQRANQMAHYLRRMGVTTEVIVGICMERSLDMVVVILAVLKAGAAYLPLDPEYPLERLAYMLDDSQAVVLLTQTRLMERLPAHWGHTVCIDREWEEIASERVENPINIASADSLAYLIYTSGTTGRPKG